MGASESREQSAPVSENKVEKFQNLELEGSVKKKEIAEVHLPKEKNEYEGREPVVEELIQPVKFIKPTSVMNAPRVRILLRKLSNDSMLLFLVLSTWLSNGRDRKMPSYSLNLITLVFFVYILNKLLHYHIHL